MGVSMDTSVGVYSMAGSEWGAQGVLKRGLCAPASLCVEVCSCTLRKWCPCCAPAGEGDLGESWMHGCWVS